MWKVLCRYRLYAKPIRHDYEHIVLPNIALSDFPLTPGLIKVESVKLERLKVICVVNFLKVSGASLVDVIHVNSSVLEGANGKVGHWLELVVQNLHNLRHLVDSVPLARQDTKLFQTNICDVLDSESRWFASHIIVEELPDAKFWQVRYAVSDQHLQAPNGAAPLPVCSHVFDCFVAPFPGLDQERLKLLAVGDPTESLEIGQ